MNREGMEIHHMPFPTPQTSGYRPPEADQGALAANSLAGIAIEEFGTPGGILRQSKITLTNFALSITDAAAHSGVKIATFPQCIHGLYGATASLTFTTTSALASTLNSGVTVQWGLGTATSSATTLATTMIDVLPGTGQTVPTFAASTTINVPSATVTNYLKAAAIFDGSGTAKDIFLNLAVGTGTDIDGDATLTVSGTIVLTWINHGDI